MPDLIAPPSRPHRTGALLACLRAISGAAPDLRLKQLQMLLIVAEHEGLIVSELAALSGETDSNVSRSIRAMTSPGDPGSLRPAFGLVELMANQTDKRVRHVVLTEKGRRLHESLGRIIAS